MTLDGTDVIVIGLFLAFALGMTGVIVGFRALFNLIGDR